MKVRLTRDHLEHKKGKEIEVTEERAHYWQRIGLVEGGESNEAPKKKKKKKAPKKK